MLGRSADREAVAEKAAGRVELLRLRWLAWKLPEGWQARGKVVGVLRSTPGGRAAEQMRPIEDLDKPVEGVRENLPAKVRASTGVEGMVLFWVSHRTGNRPDTSVATLVQVWVVGVGEVGGRMVGG